MDSFRLPEMKMVEIVINVRYGGFCLSNQAIERIEQLLKLKNDRSVQVNHALPRPYDIFFCRRRTHPILVEVVKELGQDASGKGASLKVVQGVDGCWTIAECDGCEYVEHHVSLDNYPIREIVLDETLSHEERLLRMKNILFHLEKVKKMVMDVE